MSTISIRNLHSTKNPQPLFCKLIIDGGQKFLERKNEKTNDKVRILWEDFDHQVKAAMAVNQ